MLRVAGVGYAEEGGVGFTGNTRRAGGEMQPDPEESSSLRHTLVVQTGN